LETEKQKMLAGELYNALDPQLVEERHQARKLLQAFNDTFAGDEKLRAALAKDLFADVGKDVWIEPPFYCDYGSNISLGDKVYFNFNCVILDPAPVNIGSNVMFGPYVQIYTATHPVPHLERRNGLEFALPIEIGSDVWVGGGVMVNPGVKIGARSVIGAGSVVTKDIPADVFAAGNPCRVIRDLD
jgi:maltose O-acetyltransferase